MSDAPEVRTSCADWVEAAHRGLTLTSFQKDAVEVLVAGFGTGPWNLNVNWRKVDWDWGNGVRFVVWCDNLATFDFDHLTRLVLAAHERCIRVAIGPRSFRYLTITCHARTRDGLMSASHPTMPIRFSPKAHTP